MKSKASKGTIVGRKFRNGMRVCVNNQKDQSLTVITTYNALSDYDTILSIVDSFMTLLASNTGFPKINVKMSQFLSSSNGDHAIERFDVSMCCPVNLKTSKITPIEDVDVLYATRY